MALLVHTHSDTFLESGHIIQLSVCYGLLSVHTLWQISTKAGKTAAHRVRSDNTTLSPLRLAWCVLTVANLIEDVVANVKQLHTLGANRDIICQHRHHVIAEVNFSQPIWHPG